VFIVFEGPEGSGKTTQSRLLQAALEQAGQQVLCTREPGGTPIGEQIRQVLHAMDNRAMLPITEALLYSAARAQLVGEVIRPALERGDIVVCDRYAYSTLAYQGDGRGLDQQMIHQLTHWATDGLEPDLVVYLDLDVKEGLRRKRQDAQGEWNRMDELDVAFHQAVRTAYLRMAEGDRARWLVINASQSIEAVHRQIWARVSARAKL
jgi:dTMP kinase